MGKGPVTRLAEYKGIPTFDTPGGEDASYPFQVTSVTTDKVLVNPFSYLLQNFDIKNNISIMGLNYPFKLQYGEKIYLETVFDANGQVAYSRIDNEAYWPIFQANTTSDGKDVQVYPNLIANLSVADQSQYNNYLANQLTRIQAQMTDQINYQQGLVNADNTNSDQDQLVIDTAELTRLTALYNAALTKIQSMINSQSSFFSTLPSGGGIVRKQVSCYNMIAYTTMDDSTNLNSFSITPDSTDVTNTGDNSSTTDTTDPFHVVPSLQSNLMLIDTFFQYTGCSYPVEYSGPVYYFKDPDNSDSEDDENTNPANQ